ncbi:MAG: class I SAM-dependent methyltransferase [Prevotellaceae bacterium]|jgi:predicted O-methyltransferase YrrM|nr:class I SAM-dependent methyltransferase [Prevotellaceae bacterium]
MKKRLKTVARFLAYRVKARHFRGHGIHSPFAFDLVTNVFEEKNPYYIYKEVEEARVRLLDSRETIFVNDFGTGRSRRRRVASIAAHSLKKRKYAQLLFRLVNAAKPVNIIELGTSLGITTAYLAAVNTATPCYSLEGCSQSLQIARRTLAVCGLNHVKLIEGNIDDTLPELLEKLDCVGFVFFDANHTKEATLNYFYQCLKKITQASVFVFDDIHHSKGMQEAWLEIKQQPQVRVSFDLFSLGIVYFNSELQKQDYFYRLRN